MKNTLFIITVLSLITAIAPNTVAAAVSSADVAKVEEQARKAKQERQKYEQQAAQVKKELDGINQN
ncbi:MAG: hypothetical protein IJ778_04560 [Alphaproteobacteria bacterium]|nr:hypothetical protein [Alphaproteobacteria bacterium]